MDPNNTYITETALNASAGHMLGEMRYPLAETIYADGLTRGEFYRRGVQEFGRCVGRVYVDTADGVAAIGYVFQSRREYEDCDETYLHETWVSIERQLEPARGPLVEPVALESLA